MARVKALARKLRLIKRERSNSPIPIWVIAKTLRKVKYRPRMRHWRRSKLKDV